MGWKLGTAVGLAVGYWAGAQADEQRKRQLDETLTKVRDNPRVQQVTDTVKTNATKVTEAVQARVTGAADTVGDAVADKAEPSDGNGTSTTASKGAVS